MEWRPPDPMLAKAVEDLPFRLVRLFGIHPAIAVKYVHAAHPDKALPRIR
ncbi:hypothetical protein ABZ341_38725 [Streptomyces sp. NPDC006173]